MRIAVSADNRDGLESTVSSHFGRCPYFILVNLVDDRVDEVREVDNPFYGSHQPGEVPDFIASLGANVMLTGGIGRQAIRFFEEYGIEAVSGAQGTVRESVERYLDGQAKGAAPCRDNHGHGHGHNTPGQDLNKKGH